MTPGSPRRVERSGPEVDLQHPLLLSLFLQIKPWVNESELGAMVPPVPPLC